MIERNANLMAGSNVRIREVGLRDGLQIVKTFLPTVKKIQWIDRCVAAGFKQMEVCSFVPEKYIAQFRDAGEVTAYAAAMPGLTAAALVPNVHGARRALAAGAHKLVCLTSATESFSRANLRRSKAESLEEIKKIIQLRDDVGKDGARTTIQVGISVAFGCPFEGRISDRDVIKSAVAAAEMGAEEISLADTAGQGDPGQVRSLFRALARELGHVRLEAHFHNTRGMGLANVLAALDEGVRGFDSAVAGLGGCPNSPGASGNIPTEDLVFMLEAMGLSTGIDIQQVLDLRQFVADQLPTVTLFGHIGAVGVPKGFKIARKTEVANEPGAAS